MNERVVELIQEATCLSWEVDHAESSINVDKLVELIIKECITVLEELRDREYGLSESIARLKEHFEVEE